MSALSVAQLAAEVMTKGFGPGGPGADDAAVTVGGPNADAGPRAPTIAHTFVTYQSHPLGAIDGDEKLWRILTRLVAEGLQALEHASLVRAQMHTESNGIDYTATGLGRRALDNGELDRILGGGTL